METENKHGENKNQTGLKNFNSICIDNIFCRVAAALTVLLNFRPLVSTVTVL